MKLTTALLVSCAALATAAPIRVVVYTNFEETDGKLGPFRVGHAAVHALDHPMAAPAYIVTGVKAIATPSYVMLPPAIPTEVVEPMVFRAGRKPCQGGQSLRVSNWFRKLVGFPTIEANPHRKAEMDKHHHHHHGEWRNATSMPPMQSHRPHAHHHHMHHHTHRPSFAHRLQFALHTLGPWEGRIVAFVLGCGIGALMRLVWVMGILAMRSFRRSEEHEIIYDIVEEEYLLPPPVYADEAVYPDEKAVLKAMDA